MRSGLKSCIGFFLLLWTGIVLPGACTCKGGGDMISEMREFDSFFSTHVDSVATAPRRMRTQVLQRMKAGTVQLSFRRFETLPGHFRYRFCATFDSGD